MTHRALSDAWPSLVWLVVFGALGCAEERATAPGPLLDDETFDAIDRGELGPELTEVEDLPRTRAPAPRRVQLREPRDAPPPSAPEPAPARDAGAAPVACGGSTEAAYKIFATRCVICHAGANRGSGGFGGVLSATSMIATGHVVPGDPARSPVYQRVESGDMPRSGDPLDEAERANIAQWIRCGAPTFMNERPPVTPDATAPAQGAI